MSTSIIQRTLALLNDAQGTMGRMPVLSVHRSASGQQFARGRKPRMSTSIIQQTLALLNDAQGKTGRMPVLSVKLILKLDHLEVIACLDEGVNGIEANVGIRHVEFSEGRLFAQCQKTLVGQLCAGDIQFDQVFHRE